MKMKRDLPVREPSVLKKQDEGKGRSHAHGDWRSNTFREYVTISTAPPADGRDHTVGSHNNLLAYHAWLLLAQVTMGKHVIMSNVGTLAGKCDGGG